MTNVLIVEDRDDNLYYLSALLSGHGHRVETARHGTEALVKARREPPDLVVSDLLMPVMDGYTLLRHWKADPRLKAIPFIVYTATYTSSEDEKLALALGADAFILKPAEPDDFLAILQEVLTRTVGSEVNPSVAPAEEKALLEVYSETLIRKLEEKMLQLEDANRTLELDIAARKAAEAARDRLFNLSLDMLCIANLDGRLEQVNPAWTTTLGWNREELTTRPWIQFVHPDDRAATVEAGAALRGGESVRDFEHRFRCRDGSYRTLVWSSHPLPEADQVFCVVRDITDRKELEAQVLRAQRMESIGALAGGIAHDLNNVLAPILMATSLLQLDETDEDRRDILGTIESSAKRGAEMVRQVLSFARGVDSGRAEVHLEHLLRDLLRIISDTFPKNIAVETAIASELGTLTADPTQLHQVLLNLCVNARDAMPDGGVIRISASNETLEGERAAAEVGGKAGVYLRLEVEDNGTGMSPETMSRIFQPFFTTKAPGKGTGLGLATSHAIVASHGGFVHVESEVGRGTSFRIYLPTRPSPDVRAASDLPDEPPRGHGELVLVVDDEASIRQIAKQTLEAFGYRVELASNGAEAVASFARRRSEVAMILTDMTMPVMDGPTMVRVLRQIDPAVRIAGAGGFGPSGPEGGGFPGLQGFLQKPYTAESLLRTVHAVLAEPAPSAGNGG